MKLEDLRYTDYVVVFVDDVLVLEGLLSDVALSNVFLNALENTKSYKSCIVRHVTPHIFRVYFM